MLRTMKRLIALSLGIAFPVETHLLGYKIDVSIQLTCIDILIQCYSYVGILPAHGLILNHCNCTEEATQICSSLIQFHSTLHIIDREI